MARISRFRLANDVLNKIFDLFFEVLGKNKSRGEFKKVIVGLFSSTERIMIAKRVAIIYLLLKNINQRTICQVLKVSSGTVVKYSLILEKSQGVSLAFLRLMRNERLINF